MGKKIVAVLFCVTIALGLCGCSQGNKDLQENIQNTENDATTEETETETEQYIEGTYEWVEPRGLGESRTNIQLFLDGTCKMSYTGTASDGSGNVVMSIELAGTYALTENVLTITSAEGVGDYMIYDDKFDEAKKVDYVVSGADSKEYYSIMRSNRFHLNVDGTFSAITEEED